jgi:hypothetical protein
MPLITEAHKNPLETVHAGPEKLWANLSPRFYWSQMKKDIVQFRKTCYICQKTKPSNFNCYGYLIPNPILFRPYDKGGGDTTAVDHLGLHKEVVTRGKVNILFGQVSTGSVESERWFFPPEELLDGCTKLFSGKWTPELNKIFKQIFTEI